MGKLSINAAHLVIFACYVAMLAHQFALKCFFLHATLDQHLCNCNDLRDNKTELQQRAKAITEIEQAITCLSKFQMDTAGMEAQSSFRINEPPLTRIND